MARQKKPVHRVQMTEGKRNIIHQLLEEYDIQTAEDIQDALKDLLGGTIKEMMEAEMDDHLGFLSKYLLKIYVQIKIINVIFPSNTFSVLQLILTFIR